MVPRFSRALASMVPELLIVSLFVMLESIIPVKLLVILLSLSSCEGVILPKLLT